MDETVKEQYESYPYPLRDPDDDPSKSLAVGPLEDIRVVNHFCFQGKRDWTKPFRVLVAGGGTGDASTALGQQLQNIGCSGEVVYLDLSMASQTVARQRADSVGITNLSFHQGSLLDVGEMDLGEFDYINCSGVLHHLEEPEAGAQALASVLAPGGAMGIMVYGEMGRTGVYHAQDMLRLLGKEESGPEKVALAKQLLPHLPHSNWLVKNEECRWTSELDDAEIFDRFLHSCDRAYRVPSVLDLMASAEMGVSEFVPPLLFDPSTFLGNVELLERVWELSRFEQYAFSELYVGAISKLSFFSVADSDPASRIADPHNPKAVPILLPASGEELADLIRSTGRLAFNLGAIELSQPLNLSPDVEAMIRSIDGRTSLQGMFEKLSAQSDLDWESFHAGFMALYHLLNGSSLMVLAIPVDSPQP
jgi:SAM-dependent methyltransferase